MKNNGAITLNQAGRHYFAVGLPSIRGDVDGSSTINVTDMTYLVVYLKDIVPQPPARQQS